MRYSQMAILIKALTSVASQLVKAFTHGRMGRCTTVSGYRELRVDMEYGRV